MLMRSFRRIPTLENVIGTHLSKSLFRSFLLERAADRRDRSL